MAFFVNPAFAAVYEMNDDKNLRLSLREFRLVHRMRMRLTKIFLNFA